MKRPEYVAAATAAIRQAVDNGRAESELSDLLGGVFSRSGFTQGYYKNRTGRDMFGVRTKEDVLGAPAALGGLNPLLIAGALAAVLALVLLVLALRRHSAAPIVLLVMLLGLAAVVYLRLRSGQPVDIR